MKFDGKRVLDRKHTIGKI